MILLNEGLFLTLPSCFFLLKSIYNIDMNRLFIVGLILFYLLLGLFFPRKGRAEYTLEPRKNVSLMGLLPTREAVDTVLSFQLNSRYGFHSPELEVVKMETMQADIPWMRKLIGKDFYIDPQSDNDRTIIRDFLGKEIGSFQSTGSAFVLNDRIYVRHIAKHIIEERDSSGKRLWELRHLPYLTAMNANKEETLLGFVNGLLLVVDQNGEIKTRYQYSGSRVETIYGCAISSSGDYIALIAGLDTQRFSILEKKDKDYYPSIHLSLSGERRSSCAIRFSSGYPLVFFDMPGQLSVYNYETHIQRNYPVDGTFLDFKEHPHGEAQYIIFSGEESATLLGTFGEKGLFLRREISSPQVSIALANEKFYLGIDQEISYYGLESR